ncbi:MAG: hemerythrin domain-containing protein [Prevotellaceae bacterium]|jgi:regulator of cell morphogenesis and NO signaling|nr:hemerythrin domain-containing protein [Prevotellaceae bacterium]
MLITSEMKLADAIHSNYLLIPVIARFGVELGFGEKTVRDVCAEHGVDVEFFTTILNVFSNEAYFPQERMLRFDALQLVAYLKKTHAYYHHVLIPQIERFMADFEQSAPPRSTAEVRLIHNFFAELKQELNTHLAFEERVTFPYIEALEQGSNFSLLQKQHPMRGLEVEHNSVDEKLNDLKNILVKYLQGSYDEGVRDTLIFHIFRLEKDLHDHTRIEEKILGPRVKRMEQEAISRLAEKLESLLPLSDAEPQGELTDREREVLAQVALGGSNKEIANSLNISLNTVITHRKNITAKLGIKTIPGLTVYAILNGIIEDTSN